MRMYISVHEYMPYCILIVNCRHYKKKRKEKCFQKKNRIENKIPKIFLR